MADKKEYIERGALIAMCKRQIECEWNTIAAPGSWADAFEDFSDLVEQTPAADVVEVRRGEWIYDFSLDGDDFYLCSVCGRQEVLNGLCAERSPAIHCPYCHCGARMDGERKEQT